MARGESEKSVPRSGALGVWGVFGTLSLAVVLLVAWSTRSCEPDTPIAPPIGDPFAGAGGLGWRDCVAEYPDAAGALAVALEERGYVRAGPAGAPLELPLVVETTALEGACGVVVVLAEPTSTIHTIGVAGGPSFPPCVPRAVTLGVCGPSRVRAAGVGQARVALWTFPGLTPRAIAATGMPPDVALAHAEAETLLSGIGLRPSPQVLVIGREPADPLELPPGPAPAAGCTGWVTAALGLGPIDTFGGGGSSHSGARERALVLSRSCHDGSGLVRAVDPGRDGGTLYSIPYRTGAAGPALPGDDDPLSRIPSVRAVAASEITLPE